MALVGERRQPVEARIVRSDGAEFVLGPSSDWRVIGESLENWSNLAYSVTTSPNVLTDGSSVVGKRVEETDRSLSGVYIGNDLETARARCIEFFNPKFSFECHLTYQGRTRWAVGEQTGFNCELSAQYAAVTFDWTIICTDPFLRSESGNESSLTDAAPMFGFPFVSHFRAPLPDGEKKPVGFLASKLLYDGENSIYNNGDVETTYTIRCECNGVVTKPEVHERRDVRANPREFRERVTLYPSTSPHRRRQSRLTTRTGFRTTSRDSNFIGHADATLERTCSTTRATTIPTARSWTFKSFSGKSTLGI